MRFARTLGFASYPAMREILQRAFRSRVTHSVRLRGRLEELRESGDFFERLVISEMDYMTQALSTVDRESLEQATELLRTRKKVFVYGVGPSISLVDLMEIRLGRFGRQVVTLTTAGREILEPLILMNDQDLLFVICFFDVFPHTAVCSGLCQRSSLSVIMLTDTLGFHDWQSSRGSHGCQAWTGL